MIRPAEPDWVVACVGLGSNLGDRRGLIESAVSCLGRVAGVRGVRVSLTVETEPVGPPGQPVYLNAAARLETTRSPRSLLGVLLEIERSHGRERRERWGPRTLDLDLLLFGDLVINEPGLRVPHPRLAERRFVLGPLTEVAPDVVDPVTGLSVRGLLERLASDARPGVVP